MQTTTRKTAGLLSQAEYSRHRGCNRSYVTRLKGRGILVMRDGLIDVAACDAALDDTPIDIEPERVPPAPPDRLSLRADSQSQGPTFAQAKTAEMVYRA